MNLSLYKDETVFGLGSWRGQRLLCAKSFMQRIPQVWVDWATNGRSSSWKRLSGQFCCVIAVGP